MKGREGQEILKSAGEEFGPTCSIIVPVHDSESYLEDCIRSVSNQTLTNYELILIDDGSSDKSRAICETFSEQDKHIRLIVYDANSGLTGQGRMKNRI